MMLALDPRSTDASIREGLKHCSDCESR